MTTLANAFSRQRQATTDTLLATWVRWEGQNRHTVALRPSGAEVIATGSDLTYQPGMQLLVGRSTRGDGRTWTILGPPPAEGRGAAAYPLILSTTTMTPVQIVAHSPAQILVGVPTSVDVVGFGFTEAPLTVFESYLPDTSDPLADTWAVDPDVTLGTGVWIDNPSPGFAYAPFPMAVIRLNITKTIIGTVSLRIL